MNRNNTYAEAALARTLHEPAGPQPSPFATVKGARANAIAWAALAGAVLGVNVALAYAYSRQGILSGEETSVSMRDPMFLELHRQYEAISTNVAAHVFYWLGQRLIPVTSLFFGRFEKAFFMSSVPLMLGLYLVKRGRVTRTSALTAAGFLALMPGFFLFAPLATEYGLECVPAMAALLLASSRKPWRRQLSAPLVTLTALTYGAGVAFIPAVGWQWLQSERSDGPMRASRLLVWFGGFAVAWLLPFVLWNNHPHLLLGGGTLSDLPTLLNHVGQLAYEAAVRGGSYYYFASAPALSQPLAAACAVLAIGWLTVRRRHLPVCMGWASAVVVYLMSGREIGMRRGVPIVLFSVLALGLTLPTVMAHVRSSRWTVRLMQLVIASSFAIAAGQYATVVQQLASGRSRLPIDFDFPLRQGTTMPQTYAYLLDHPGAIDATYEPERTLAVLHYLRRDAADERDAAAVFSVSMIAARLGL